MAVAEVEISSGLVQCGLPPADFTGSGDKAVRGPCPKCGGSRRLVIFFNGAFPRWFARCDLCGFEGWAPALFPGVKWPDGPIGEMPAPEPKDYTRPLAVLKESKMDEVLHNNLTPEVRAEWRDMGVPDSWQDFYNLGYIEGRPFRQSDGKGVLVLNAFSIPKYDVGWDIKNIDFRMIDPPDGEGKYRPFPGAPPTPFLSRPDLPLINPDGQVYIVEGAKKAMVTGLFLDRQVIGVPSSNSWAGIADRVKDAPVVYVILDPNAWNWSRKLAKAIGASARQVTLPTKIDDAILCGALTEQAFQAALTFARRENTSESTPTQ